MILTAVLLMIGFQTIIMGLLGDTVAANRKILEDVQYHVRWIHVSLAMDEIWYGCLVFI